MYDLTPKLKKVDAYNANDGEYKIRLDANESYFDIKDYFGDEILSELSKIKYNRYPDILAEDTVKAFSALYNVDEKYVTAGNGSDELISIICSCFLQKNDKILTLSPDFSMYAFYSYLYELRTETLHKNDDFTIDVSEVSNYCNNHDIKAIIFSNPCNPTSVGLSREDVIKLIKNVFCLVIIDEAYMDFWDQSIIPEIEKYDNVIILKTCSKSMGIAAIRLGFAIASEKITGALRAVKSPYNTDTISQIIGKIVMSNPKVLGDMTAEIIKNRDVLQEKIEHLAFNYNKFEYVYKSVTNFIFIKTDYADEIYEELKKRSISIRKMNGHLRICTGSEAENAEFLAEFEDVLKNLE